ncbi:APC family permease [Pedobacter sp. SYP-B3415]|uniref:APC family permease n=1 Tax=Pedobacter sp. SYP-B3415 TaxID=2496641 RepID=UPI00101CD509|nr:amino acid permease [Pedobacter sp. SYP-B3415]
MQIKKQLSLFDLAMIVVSLVIGMGIFRTPVNVAAKAGSVELFFAAWIAGGVVALCGALTFAEIGSRYPLTGAYYKIFSIGYHPAVAFSINCIGIVSSAASVAAVTLIGSEYICAIFFPEKATDETYRGGIAIASILLLYCINLLGLKASSKTQNVLTIVKILTVVVLISAILFTPQAPASGTVLPAATGWQDYGKMLGLCLIAVSFSFAGYQATINFGGETKEARRILPRAIIIGLLLIISLYLLINYAYVWVIGFDALGSADSIAAILAGSIFGPKGYTILSVLIFLSVLGYVNVNLLSNPRIMFAMGQERALPAVFSQTTKRKNVMAVSLSVYTAMAVLIIFFAKTFDKILNYTIFLECISMASGAAAIFMLRKAQAGKDESTFYKVKLYPFIPLLFILAYVFVAVSIYGDDPAAALTGVGAFAGFCLIYFIFHAVNKRKTAT